MAMGDGTPGRHPHIRLHSQLEDAHLYLVKRWVLDYLAENR